MHSDCASLRPFKLSGSFIWLFLFSALWVGVWWWERETAPEMFQRTNPPWGMDHLQRSFNPLTADGLPQFAPHERKIHCHCGSKRAKATCVQISCSNIPLHGHILYSWNESAAEHCLVVPVTCSLLWISSAGFKCERNEIRQFSGHVQFAFLHWGTWELRWSFSVRLPQKHGVKQPIIVARQVRQRRAGLSLMGV